METIAVELRPLMTVSSNTDPTEMLIFGDDNPVTGINALSSELILWEE